MERSKAVIASAVVAVGLTLSAGVYIAGSGLLAGATDNVGNLKPAVASPAATIAPTTVAPPTTSREIVVVVDPSTGSASTSVPDRSPTPAVTVPRVAAVPPSTQVTTDDHGGERRDDDHDDGDDHDDDHGGEREGDEDDD